MLSFHPQEQELGPPRCLRCGYRLDGLEEPRCPECGREFDPAIPLTFARKPPFVFWLYWLPGFVLAVVGALVLSLYFLLLGNIGWGLTLGVPFALGAILGYGTRLKVIALWCAAIVATATVATALITAHPEAIFCGMVLGCIFLVPVLVGALVGFALRAMLRASSRYSQGRHLPFLLLLLAPLGLDALEHRLPPPPIAVVTTTTELRVPPARAWECLMFYEDVRHEPPLLLRLGLPIPDHTEGRIDGVGDVKVCVYRHGRLAKRVTQYEPGALLAFDVIEQHHVEDHAAKLVRGSFRFEPVGDGGRTRVTLTTEYQPLMTPRWCWRLPEEMVAGALHGHVLEGMRLRAAETSTPSDQSSPHVSEARP